MWEGRSKDRREKSKYTEWECGDSSWDNLLIWFHTHFQKPTSEWTCFIMTLWLLSVSLQQVLGPAPCCRLPLAALPAPSISTLSELAPTSRCWAQPAPLLWSMGTDGVTVTLHLLSLHHPVFPWSGNWAGETPILPQLTCYKRRKKSVFLSLTEMSLRDISARQMPPVGPGEQGGGVGQVKAR